MDLDGQFSHGQCDLLCRGHHRGMVRFPHFQQHLRGEGTPLLARLLATAYSLCATFYMYSTLSQQVRTVTDFANGFAAASQTQELSAAAQRMAAFDGTVPSIVNTVFVVAIVIFQLAGIWMKRDSA